MGKGGGTPPPQQVTTTTSNLPEYAKPFFTSLLQRGEALSKERYRPFTGQRIAGPTPAGEQAERSAFTYGTSPLRGVDTGQAAFYDTATMGQRLPGVATDTGTLAAQAQQVGAAGEGIIFGSGTGQALAGLDEAEILSNIYDPASTVQRYANPFIEQVLRGQERSAERRFREAQGARDARTLQAGAFGGSRRAVADSLARRDLDERLDRMGAEARRDAFTTGLAAAERQQRLRAEQRQRARELGLQTQQEQQRRRLGVLSDAQRLAAEAQDRRLRQAEALDRQRLGAAQSLIDAEVTGRDLRSKQIAQLSALGETQRLREQARLDQALQDFIDQRDAPRQQLQFLSSLLRGVPITAESSVVRRQAPPSPYSALLGLGLGASGLSRLLG